MAKRRKRSESQPQPNPPTGNKETTDPRTDRKSFLEALGFIKPGIASNSIIEQSEMVLMDGERLVSYNDEIAVSHPYPIGFKGGVYANELHKLIQKLPTDKIEIGEAEEDGQNQLVIRCENTEAGFFIMKDVSIPELGIDDIGDAWIELPSDFCNGINLCLSSAATDVTKGILTCLHIEGQIILACDNYRATRYELKDAFPDSISFDVPRQAAKDLSVYSPKEVAWNKESNWIHFRNDAGTIFSARTTAGDYPNVSGLFSDIEGEKIPLPKDLKGSLGRAEILADEDQKTQAKVVHIEVSKGQIICSGEGQNGWVTEKIKTTHKGDVPKFGINPSLLVQILDMTQEVTLTERSLFFEGDHISHVVALMAK